MAECPRESCWPDVGCSLGHLDLSKCPSMKAAPRTKREDRPPSDAVAMPWSGGALGLADLGFVAGRSKPIVLAIMGPQNAGKTTTAGCLVSVARTRLPDRTMSCGSPAPTRLPGWEAVASFLRWKPGSIPPIFPPHTSSRSGRMPGLLHLAFKRRDNDHHRDYVMTDAPGEWFRKWAVKR